MRRSDPTARPTTASRRPRLPRRRSDQRGVALIMVTAVVAILTAVAVEFTWRERVNLHLASHARDELRAEYLARSAVNLGRTLLAFQEMLSAQAKALGLPDNVALDLTALPLDCGLLQMAAQGFGPPPEEPTGPEGEAQTSFGDFSGGCEAEIRKEDSNINLNHLDGLPVQRQQAVDNLLRLFSDPDYDFLFEEEDRWGVRLTREEVVAAIKDFIDGDHTQDALVPDEKGQWTLVPGTADEAYYYDRLEPSQGPKNAAFDSIDELNRIPGIGDYFMAAFADHLTVYTGKNSKLVIDPRSPADLCRYLLMGAEDPNQALGLCDDPVFMEGFYEQVEAARGPLGVFSISPDLFKTMMEQNGITPNTFAFPPSTNAVFGTSAKTFTILATGRAGEVEKTIEAVVTFEGGSDADADASDPLGRLLHWEER